MTSYLRRTGGKIALVALGLSLGAASAAFAAAQVFATDGQLNGCAQRETGQLRLSTPDHPCNTAEQPLTWNVQGPPGPPGPKGEKGEKGDAGSGGSLDTLDGTACTIHGKTGTARISPAPVGFSVNVFCLAPDDYEPNDSRQAPRSLGNSFAVTAYGTLYPAGDDDWFALNGVRVSSWIVSVPLDTPLEVELYRDGTPVASGKVHPPTPFSFFNPDSATPSDWLVHVTGENSSAYFVSMMGAFPPPPMP